jgi:predicted ester cyclase
MLRTVRLLYSFWNTGDVKYVQAAVSPDFRDNTLQPGRPQGIAGFQRLSHGCARPEDYPRRCGAAPNKAVIRMVFTGHNTGPFMGHPASGKPIRFISIDIQHFRNGKIFEDWHLEDNLTYQKQIGIVKP